MEVRVVPALQDNYAYLLHHGGQTAVVDPSEAKPVLAALSEAGWKLDYILNTHHHWDHIGGNKELAARFGCPIVHDKTIELGGAKMKVIRIPGHTLDHTAFWFEAEKIVFTGDTLFSIGCGRMFEGTPEQMWASLSTLAELPDDTLVYCGHEYTAANLKFARSLEPDSADLKAKEAEVIALRSEGKPTIPSLLGEEKRLNPFLRAGSASRFADLRHRKDHF